MASSRSLVLKSGQENIEVDKLRISPLPQQEIRLTLFPAGADDQVRVGLAASIEVLGKQLLRQLLGAPPSRGHLLAKVRAARVISARPP